MDNAIPNGYMIWPNANGLIVPKDTIDAQLESLKKARALAREKRRTMYGQFFSDWNKLTGLSMSGAVEKPANEVSYSFLRDAFARSAIDQIIVNARLMQIKRVAQICQDPKTQVGFKVVNDRHFEADFKEDEETKRRCRECEEVILNPNRHIHPNGFRDFIVTAILEELVVDRKAMIIFKDRIGRPKSYHLIDGTTVKPIMTVLLPWFENNYYQYKKENNLNVDYNEMSKNPFMVQQAMQWAQQRAAEDDKFNPANVDLTRAAYVQEVDSQIVAGWTEDEISVNITNPSIEINRLPYGQGSLFQQSLDITAAWVNAWEYNQELFRTNYPEALMTVYGDYDPNGLEAFKREIYGEAGAASWHRLAVVPAGDKNENTATITPLRNTPQEMLFSELLRFIINLKCGSFRMNPSTINFSVDRGGGNYMFEANNKDVISLAQEEGFYSILENMADWLTRTLVKPRYPDLRMVWEGLNKEDEKAKIEQMKDKATTWVSIDEIRKQDNLKGDLPFDAGKLPANATVLQTLRTMMQMKMQEQQNNNPAAEQNKDNPGKEESQQEQKVNNEKEYQQKQKIYNPQKGNPQRQPDKEKKIEKSKKRLKIDYE